MSYDEQPDGDPHGECAAEIRKLRNALASISLAERDTATAAADKVRDMARIARQALEGAEPPKTCPEAGWKPTCDQCAAGLYERCRYVVPIATQATEEWKAGGPRDICDPAPAPLPLMRAAFRTSVSDGSVSRYELRFKFGSPADMHAADGEWRAFIAAQQQEQT